MRISDWSSYVCSSDLPVQVPGIGKKAEATVVNEEIWNFAGKTGVINVDPGAMPLKCSCTAALKSDGKGTVVTYTWEVKATVPLIGGKIEKMARSEEHTSELQSLMRTSYAVFCWDKLNHVVP